MKIVLKGLFYPILLILNFAILCGLITCCIWYLIPSVQGIFLAEYLQYLCIAGDMNVSAIIYAVIFVMFSILSGITGVGLNSKYKNFLLHLMSWVATLVSIGIVGATFIMTQEMHVSVVALDLYRKVWIGICLIVMFIHHILIRKTAKLMDRRVQAYETAKELNVKGRSSVIVTNIIKYIELFLPEVCVLMIMSLCVDSEVSKYFIVVLALSLIPLICNIIADYNIRADADRKANKERATLVKEVAEAVRGDVNQ